MVAKEQREFLSRDHNEGKLIDVPIFNTETIIYSNQITHNFNCLICDITSTFDILSGKHKGVGILIGPRVVLTTAHILFQYNSEIKKVKVSHVIIKDIKSRQVFIPKEYKEEVNKSPSGLTQVRTRNDWGLIFLSFPLGNIITQMFNIANREYLRVSSNSQLYSFFDFEGNGKSDDIVNSVNRKISLIRTVNSTKKANVKENKVITDDDKGNAYVLIDDKTPILYRSGGILEKDNDDKEILKYKIDTELGYSGSIILLRIENQENRDKNKEKVKHRIPVLIGIHSRSGPPAINKRPTTSTMTSSICSGSNRNSNVITITNTNTDPFDKDKVIDSEFYCEYNLGCNILTKKNIIKARVIKKLKSIPQLQSHLIKSSYLITYQLKTHLTSSKYSSVIVKSISLDYLRHIAAHICQLPIECIVLIDSLSNNKIEDDDALSALIKDKHSLTIVLDVNTEIGSKIIGKRIFNKYANDNNLQHEDIINNGLEHITELGKLLFNALSKVQGSNFYCALFKEIRMNIHFQLNILP